MIKLLVVKSMVNNFLNNEKGRIDLLINNYIYSYRQLVMIYDK